AVVLADPAVDPELAPGLDTGDPIAPQPLEGDRVGAVVELRDHTGLGVLRTGLHGAQLAEDADLFSARAVRGPLCALRARLIGDLGRIRDLEILDELARHPPQIAR